MKHNPTPYTLEVPRSPNKNPFMCSLCEHNLCCQYKGTQDRPWKDAQSKSDMFVKRKNCEILQSDARKKTHVVIYRDASADQRHQHQKFFAEYSIWKPSN